MPNGIRRVNSFYQRTKTGSLSLECEKLAQDADDIVCQPWITTPQCSGYAEGCAGNQWIGGFQAFVVDNSTNAVLLDPICCSSKSIKVESLTCANETLNDVQQPFEHNIVAQDLIYRGMSCRHAYDVNNTVVDLIWKLEVCQYSGEDPFPLKPFHLEHCPPCDCHCGIDVCGDGREPVRVIHKKVSKEKCSCDCLCHHECI
uniref:Uncharacterized protein n=1 Tax=Panagrolaimus sp. JU765 TaxID=591449 RepID=A0AC34QYH3_9BILA